MVIRLALCWPSLGRLFGSAAALIVLAWLTSAKISRAGEPGKASNAPAAAAKPTFDKVGPQVGEQLPDLQLRTIKDEVQRLGDAWRSAPALIVTSSLTCPKSRSRWPELAAIAKKYGDKLNVVVLYVIEAHPVGSVCPYKGVEDITPENERDGILRKQPKDLEERIELAREFKRYLHIDAPIYVDLLDNRAWKAVGAAPNIAFLVDEKTGMVAARQGWFEGKTLQTMIDEYFAKQPTDEQRRKEWERAENAQKAIYEKIAQAGINPWELHRVVDGDKADKLAALLKKVPDAASLVIQSAQGHSAESTLLMDAAAAGNLAAVELLLKHGADVHARTRSFESPLQAARFSNLELVKLLLRHKADVNVPSTGKTPLHEAVISDQREAAKLLLEAGAKQDFFTDIALGKIDAVRNALTADPSRAGRPDGASRVPLDYAAATNQLEVARLLVERGAPIVDAELSAIEVPLHRAIGNNNVAMVKLLLDAGHSPNTAKGHRGESAESEPALHMAILGDKIEIIKLLLAHKADLKKRDTYSKMPLHYAASLGNAEIVKLLLKAGADVKATTLGFSLPCGSGEEERPEYNTPLHFAAAVGNPETIQALLTGGAVIDTPNAKGYTPLMSALMPPIYTSVKEEMQLKNIALLLASGAKINALDKEGRTALDLAANSESFQLKSPEVKETMKQGLIALLKKHGAISGKK
jgi:ankyrin repeat protein